MLAFNRNPLDSIIDSRALSDGKEIVVDTSLDDLTVFLCRVDQQDQVLSLPIFRNRVGMTHGADDGGSQPL